MVSISIQRNVYLPFNSGEYDLVLQGTPLQEAQNVVDLGLTIDNNLNWGLHIGNKTFRHKTFRQQDGGRRFGNKMLPKRLSPAVKTFRHQRRFGNKKNNL